MDNKCSSSPPQRHKNRSKSASEIQQVKKAFHTPQKSLPGKTDLDKLKEAPEGTGTPSSSSEELK